MTFLKAVAFQTCRLSNLSPLPFNTKSADKPRLCISHQKRRIKKAIQLFESILELVPYDINKAVHNDARTDFLVLSTISIHSSVCGIVRVQRTTSIPKCAHIRNKDWYYLCYRVFFADV
jgi:hypothetical protein